MHESLLLGGVHGDVDVPIPAKHRHSFGAQHVLPRENAKGHRRKVLAVDGVHEAMLFVSVYLAIIVCRVDTNVDTLVRQQVVQLPGGKQRLKRALDFLQKGFGLLTKVEKFAGRDAHVTDERPQNKVRKVLQTNMPGGITLRFVRFRNPRGVQKSSGRPPGHGVARLHGCVRVRRENVKVFWGWRSAVFWGVMK